MKSNKSQNIIIALLIFIIIILVIVLVLVLNGTININFDNKNDNNIENNNNLENNDKVGLVELTLPSGNTIKISKEYETIFNNSTKIIAKTDNCNMTPKTSTDINNSELTLDDYIEKISNAYPDNFYTGNKVSISNTLFDFDNDGINEILLSLYESFILLHYYDNRVYGYELIGYRTNGNFRVNGTASFSASAFESGRIKYSFNGSNLVCNEVAYTTKDNSDTENNDIKINYILNHTEVTEQEYKDYLNELDKNELINYVQYSSKS